MCCGPARALNHSTLRAKIPSIFLSSIFHLPGSPLASACRLSLPPPDFLPWSPGPLRGYLAAGLSPIPVPTTPPVLPPSLSLGLLIVFVSYEYSIHMYYIPLLLVNGKRPVNYVYNFPVSGSARPIAVSTYFIFLLLEGKNVSISSASWSLFVDLVFFAFDPNVQR